MRTYEYFLFPILLIVIGILSLSGVTTFGAAFLEGAAWKQNVIYGVLLIFAMLPPSVREMRFVWMVAGFTVAFFIYGGANIWGAVGLVLRYEKLLLAALMIFLAYRLFTETWKVNKLYIIVPVLGIVSVALLFPIQDQNIIGSGFDALTKWSTSAFTSDKGFHIYLGLTGIFAGLSEIIIMTKSSKTPTE